MDSTGSLARLPGERLAAPAAATHSELSPGDMAAALGTTAPMVLLLEDDREVAETIADCLHGAGYRTMCVADGTAALAQVQQRGIALVLLNWGLVSRLGGGGLVESLRAACPRLPMVVMSDDAPALLEANRLGVEDYLPNPGRLDDLLHVVDEYCR